MPEENKDGLLAQIPEEEWAVTEKEWKDAGKTPEGPIGFKIDDAKPGALKTNDDRILPTCELELSIVSRPGQKIEPAEKMFTRIIIKKGSISFGAFKSLCDKAGLKTQGNGLKTTEAIRALKGRTAYGTVKHKGEFVNLGMRFGTSFEDLTAKRK